ncbi:MAG: PQQ-dependent sugar dehydrogenase [Thaumarchaeota archaeon]|nr:PQQ-dependent sugar dehydrogenase [Nitrososphaerota archaeon]
MDKKFRIAGIIGALIFSFVILTSPSEPLPIPPPNFQATENKTIQILATNLEKPWALDFFDDRIFVTEKNGKIRVIESDVLLEEPLATLRTADIFDGGLLGITIHPDFANNHFLFVYFTYVENDQLWNKVLRITESENKLKDAITILEKIPGSKFSNGGVIKFGPDNKLYVATGAGLDSSHDAQDLDSLAGKILRLNDDGSIPNDNPFSNSLVFSYGHSNPRGMAWDNSGNLYVTETGPTKNDEINLVIAGKNYGWPEQQCSGDEKFVDAIICYDPAIEPGGIIFYSGNKLEIQNDMIMASMKPENLDRLKINGKELEYQKSMLSGLGRIRDVGQGPDGYLYIITSNTDGKAFPDSTDDKLVRIFR